MKSIWNGTLSFGLVNIPIRLYSAVEQGKTKTRLLHKEKLSPIRYKKWCDDCEEEVPNEDIVKGVEVEKGEYAVLDDEELKAMRPEKSSRVEIVEFIDSHQIDPIFFHAHYYAGPNDDKDKTYVLFREALRDTAKTAIGRFVMREKEYVCAIGAYQRGLLLTTLNYAEEIRPVDQVPHIGAEHEVQEAELDLARQLIGRISVEEFDMGKFKETYQEEFRRLLKRKAQGETVSVERTQPQRTTEEDLVEALKKSLA